MKFIYSKIAIAVICLNGSLAHDMSNTSANKSVFLTEVNKNFISGWSFGVSKSHAFDTWDVGCGICGPWETFIPFVPPPFDPDPGAGGGGDEGSDGGGGSNYTPVNDAEGVADLMVAIQTLKNKLAQLALRTSISPETAARIANEIRLLDAFLRKTNNFYEALSTGIQATIHLAEQDYVAAVSEVSGLLAGVGTYAGVNGLLMNATGRPLLVIIGASAAAFLIADFVENNTPGVIAALEDALDFDYDLNIDDPIGGQGPSWGDCTEAYDSSLCEINRHEPRHA
ncbi:hypothetical protein [Glaciecola sp. SC05]|uniref:hypothetical protein n=1 Tax=Glaciecola sp. SC05 TaxID=1987355 RepID=UPI0035293D65